MCRVRLGSRVLLYHRQHLPKRKHQQVKTLLNELYPHAQILQPVRAFQAAQTILSVASVLKK